MISEAIIVEIGKLQLQPGDRLLIKSYELLGEDERDELCKAFLEFLGPDIPALLVCGDVHVQVIEPAEKLFG